MPDVQIFRPTTARMVDSLVQQNLSITIGERQGRYSLIDLSDMPDEELAKLGTEVVRRCRELMELHEKGELEWEEWIVDDD